MLIPGGEELTRDELIRRIETGEQTRNEWIRRQVIEYDRVDILAEEVLGYKLQPFHKLMLRHSLAHKETLQLAFRGAGKTTSVEIVRVIHAIVKNPDVRILIGSKTMGFAQDILREIKQHLAENERFVAVFGDLVDDAKWDAAEIMVRGRTKPMKESTITCVGVGGQLIGKHFDAAFLDDLVDEDNSRTETGRNTIKVWYYKVLQPTLEPHARLHLFGTRYHFHDLYGWLSENEMSETVQVIPALDIHGRSPWPDKYPVSFFKKKRADAGTIIFSAQYQCDSEAMKGDIFLPDWMGAPIGDSDIPDKAKWYAGIDLAISQKDSADMFAMVGIAVHGPDIYIAALEFGHYTFSQQTDAIIRWWDTGFDGLVDKRRLVRFGIEINAYQDAQYQRLREKHDEMNLKPIQTLKDKITNAHRMAARFEEGHVHIHKRVYNHMLEHLLQFPSGRKDVFDALFLAYTTAFKRERAQRKEEVGVI